MASRATNRQIVQELQAGDRRGCAHLLDAYQAKLTWEAEHVFRLLREDSEEIVSDVLLSVVRKIHRFQFRRGEEDFHFWVMAVFRNKVRDFLRHQALTRGVMEYFDEQRLEDVEASSPTDREVVASFFRSYQASLERDELDEAASEETGALHKVTEVLEKLEPWERVLLRCRALDVPYEEISGYTGKNVKQLKVYHARVRRKFLRIFENLSQEVAAQ